MKKLRNIDEKIDFKLDYMATMFKKIAHKRFETYVIQRIWHRLNDNDIQFVTQQYVKRPKVDEYALADLYLPQMNMIVEINEPYHYRNDVQKHHDELRNADVSRIANSEIHVVDCRGSIDEVNTQIEQIVNRIREKKNEKESRNEFFPWLGISNEPAKYYAQKQYLDVRDNEYVETIDDICDIFHTKAIHRGFLRAGGVILSDKLGVWFPNTENKLWCNSLIEEGLYICEYPYDEVKRSDHVKKHCAENRQRITFLRQKDALGFNLYKFVGVFEIDKQRSMKENKCYWKRIADKVSLKEILAK